MKKILALVLAMAMVFSLAACGESKTASTTTSTTETTETKAEATEAKAETYKVGMICIGDSAQAYDKNFMIAAEDATEKLAAEGINVEWLYKENHPNDDDTVTTDNLELVEEGCVIVFNNSYGQDPYMDKAAAEAEDTVFVGLTACTSRSDDLENTANAFARIFEGRYLVGVAAGMKLNEMIEKGEITEDEAVIGYVGAFHYAEIISGYTAFFQGARSVCPSATMYVQFINSWGNATEEANAADALIKNHGCAIIAQHTDHTTPATTAQEASKSNSVGHPVYHIGYNIDMTDVAPEASIISTRIDWSDYFVKMIKIAINGEEVPQDYCGGLDEGMVVLTELNEAVAAPGTAEALEAAKAAIISGEVKVFDTSKFTVNGEVVTEAMAFDTDGDWVPDSQNYIVDGVALESEYQSAPYFALDIDGITLDN